MVENEVYVYLVKRCPEYDFGHLGLVYNENRKRVFRGYRPNLADVLKEAPEAPSGEDLYPWLEGWLKTNTLPGYIVNDVNLGHAFRNKRTGLWKEYWADSHQVQELKELCDPGQTGWRLFGRYTLDVPNFPPFQNFHNCVTWALEILNKVIENAIEWIPSGRIREAVEVLKRADAVPSESIPREP